MNISALVDTEPPALQLQRSAYAEVLQATPYTDAGALVYDNVDGHSLVPRMVVAVCTRPPGLSAANAAMVQPTACVQAAMGTVNTSLPSHSTSAHVVLYSAEDAAGNAAVPVYRWVVVMPRWVAGRNWHA